MIHLGTSLWVEIKRPKLNYLFLGKLHFKVNEKDFPACHISKKKRTSSLKVKDTSSHQKDTGALQVLHTHTQAGRKKNLYFLV